MGKYAGEYVTLQEIFQLAVRMHDAQLQNRLFNGIIKVERWHLQDDKRRSLYSAKGDPKGFCIKLRDLDATEREFTNDRAVIISFDDRHEPGWHISGEFIITNVFSETDDDKISNLVIKCLPKGTPVVSAAS